MRYFEKVVSTAISAKTITGDVAKWREQCVRYDVSKFNIPIYRKSLDTISDTINNVDTVGLQNRTPAKNKKQESWSRLGFLINNGRVLHQLQYNDFRVSYIPVKLSLPS